MTVLRSRGTLLLAIFLLVPATFGCGDDAVTGASDLTPARSRLAALDEDTDGIHATIEAFNAAFDAEDATGLASLFTPNAEFYSYDGRAQSVDEFLGEIQQAWASWTDGRTEYSLRGIKVARPYGWAKLDETFTYNLGGTERTMSSLVTLAFERQGGKWLIGHLHISSDSPPGPPS